MSIPRRARLCDTTGQRYLRMLHREETAVLLAAGAIEADEVRGKLIVSFKLTATRLKTTDARAGSFGIVREHLSNGVIFAHQRSVYGELNGQR